MGRIDTRIGFLTRLARDVRGNTLAIMAAALLPLAGLIGGGVDMSRLYLVKTRLQQACDAGALAGRKAMAAGAWTTGSGNGSTNDKAEKMFDANFSSGQYGSGTRIRAFTESNGIVSGNASVPIPMTIMKVFGMTSRTLSVTCQAKMELPNTDVMFVLDMTASMQDLPSCAQEYCGNGVNGSRRIDGLKKAVKCFYEALEKVSTPEPCTYSGGTYTSTGDPTATTASTTAQVRIGFVPYGVNVNVGKVLPNNVMADNWTYQSRVATTTTAHAWTLDSAVLNQNWTGTWTNPSSVFDTSRFNASWSTVGASATMNDGTVLPATKSGPTNTTTCDNSSTINPLGSGTTSMAGIQDSATGTAGALSSATPTDQNPPVWVSSGNPSVQNQSTSRSRTNTISKGYKYFWVSNACRLRSASPLSSYTTYNQTQGGTGTKAITWTDYPGAWSGWTYQAMMQNVSGLKAGGSTWNNTVSLPVTRAQSGPSVTLSGSSTAAQIWYPASTSVTWDGCIEEAKTFQNTDGNATDDWGTLPASAYDMNVNLIPNGTSINADWASSVASAAPAYSDTTTFSPNTFWGPMLAKTGTNNGSIYGAVWVRTDGSGNWTRNASTTTSSYGGQTSSDYKYVCTTAAARKLAEYRTSTDFLNYVNALDAQDIGTYHDIGMLWGARFISPLGIFASENALAATGGAIQRHLIFMTDGGTNTVYNNYNAYGLSYFNRYQFNFDVSSSANETYTDAALNARLINICNQVKNMNIQLWVVSYGASVNTTTQDRLRSCATDANHFFNATDTPTLISNFQAIAAKISALRLTG